MKDLWKRYAADFNAMTDAEIEEQYQEYSDSLDEAEEWIEAVEAWKDAGSPRT